MAGVVPECPRCSTPTHKKTLLWNDRRASPGTSIMIILLAIIALVLVGPCVAAVAAVEIKYVMWPLLVIFGLIFLSNFRYRKVHKCPNCGYTMP